jgi:hypothetical protein
MILIFYANISCINNKSILIKNKDNNLIYYSSRIINFINAIKEKEEDLKKNQKTPGYLFFQTVSFILACHRYF